MGPYSQDLRERIVKAVDQGQSIAEVAARYEVSERTVKRYLKRREERGTIEADGSPGRPRLIQQEQEAVLIKQSESYPDATVAQHRDRWNKGKKVKLSSATMCRALLRVGQTRKKRPSLLSSVMK
jgi:transposase